MGYDSTQGTLLVLQFEIGAMSRRALSKTAIEAFNKGALLGGFAHKSGRYW